MVSFDTEKNDVSTLRVGAGGPLRPSKKVLYDP